MSIKINYVASVSLVYKTLIGLAISDWYFLFSLEWFLCICWRMFCIVTAAEGGGDKKKFDGEFCLRLTTLLNERTLI